MVDTALLTIHQVPIKINVSVSNGEFVAQKGSAPVSKIQVNQTSGEFEIHAEPIKIKIDNYAARSSLGLGNYNQDDFTKRKANNSIQAAYEGTAEIVNEGNQKARGAEVADLVVNEVRADSIVRTVMDFLPKENADITFDKGELNINYRTGNLDINFNDLDVKPMRFIPGKVEINVEQRPSLTIEYHGKPIYVPPREDNISYDIKA